MHQSIETAGLCENPEYAVRNCTQGPWGNCARAGTCLLTEAMTDYSDDGFADAYNRELEEEALGRPLFPNEY